MKRANWCFLTIHSYFRCSLSYTYWQLHTRRTRQARCLETQPKFFAQETPDDIFQDCHEICTPVSLSNRKKSDQSKAHKERKVPRVKTGEVHVLKQREQF